MFNNLKKGIKLFFSDNTNIYILVFFLFLLSLSFFRDTYADETLYLRETMIMSELLKKGIWIGDYGVGTHGFLFKLPVAFFFIILGKPSVFIATLYTIIISIVCLFLLKKIVNEFFDYKKWGIWIIILFSTFLYFINTSVSFNRDIPALFTVILFIYLFLKKSNKWVLGLILLLMLDAKEHVFLTVAPLYGFYVVIDEFCFHKIKAWIKTIWSAGVRLLSGYYLCIIWVFLMFTTSIIPINMFWASILGVIDSGSSWVTSQFSPEVASSNLMDDQSKEIPKLSEISVIEDFINDINEENKESVVEKEDNEIPSEDEHIENTESKGNNNSVSNCLETSVICRVISFGDILVSYLGKVLYPRTFSFISIPKLIILPAVAMALISLKKYWKLKDRKILLPIVLLFNVFVVIFRASHGRYILPVTPIVAIFFIDFFKNGQKDLIFFRNVIILTSVYEILGLFFESTFLFPKIVLTFGLLILLWFIYIFKNHRWNKGDLFFKSFLGILSIVMLAIMLQFSLSIGQLSQYLKYGVDREMKIVAQHLDSDKKVWINNYGAYELLQMYRLDMGSDPEWHWKLDGSVPKKHLLKIYSPLTTFSDEIIDLNSFLKYIETNKIEQLIFVVSTLEGEEFPNQSYKDDLLLLENVSLYEEISLKNKIVYILNVGT